MPRRKTSQNFGGAIKSVVATKKLDLTRHVGTELAGFSLLDLSDAGVQEILQLVAERGVVVVRDQPMTIPEQISFGRRMGGLHVPAAYAQSQ